MGDKVSERDWFGVVETAERLGLHPNTVKRIDPRDLPYVRIVARGDRKYRADDVAAYIERRTVTGREAEP